jgi:hypothetical protein
MVILLLLLPPRQDQFWLKAVMGVDNFIVPEILLSSKRFAAPTPACLCLKPDHDTKAKYADT